MAFGRQHCNYVKKGDALLLEELLTVYCYYICICSLVYFARSALNGSRGWLQSTENIEEKYYDQLIYYLPLFNKSYKNI